MEVRLGHSVARCTLTTSVLRFTRGDAFFRSRARCVYSFWRRTLCQAFSRGDFDAEQRRFSVFSVHLRIWQLLLQAAATLGDEVIIKAGQDGRLDSAVLACADIDLYSRNLKSTRLRGAYSASKGLPTIQEKSVRPC